MSDAEEIPVKPGDILARKYRVERVLGIGGMGAVVAAIHLELDQRVALKFLLPSVAAKPEVVSRFAREARAAAKIRSEHVARVTDVGTLENGTPYIVMEYLEGQDLDAIVTNNGPLPIPLAVDYLLQASVAIAEAHMAGIVHRDLKPGNFFLARQTDGSEIVKVLDFGISKSLAGGPESGGRSGVLTKTTDVFGSPLYMSPEQLKSSRDVDARADLWALGVILFELVSGQAPFDRGTVAEIFGAILHEKPLRLRAALPSAPGGLEQVVACCLEKEPERRYSNIGELASALSPFGSADSLVSLQRITRVMQGAGSGASLPPPSVGPRSSSVTPGVPLSSVLPGAPAGTNRALHPGASTRTAWGATDEAPKPRAIGPIIAVIAMSAIAGAALFLALRWNAAAPGSVPAAEPPRPSAIAPPPSASAAASAAPTATATNSDDRVELIQIPPEVPLEPTADQVELIQIPPEVPLEPTAEVVPAAPLLPGPVRLPRGKFRGSNPVTKKPAGKTPKEDPDGFGDRK
jgi:eukaryotic-like serine/threonine-protein kinase